MRNAGKNLKVSLNNTVIAYNDEGPEDAPAIVFIHAFPFSKDMWELQTEVLKYYYRTISYDIRGHGDSESNGEDFSIDLFADDLFALIDHLNLSKVTLCGLSIGGYIALNAISKFPQRIEALVLCDTQCVADNEEAREGRMRSIDSIREKGVEKFADETVKKLFTEVSFSRRKEQVNSARNMILRIPEQTLVSTVFALANRTETCSKLPEIQVPSLILVGKEDNVTPPSSSEVIHKRIKHSTYHVIEHAGHLSNLENTDEFNSRLKDFLDKHLKKDQAGKLQHEKTA